MSSFQIAKHSRQQIGVELKRLFLGGYHLPQFKESPLPQCICKPNGSMELQDLERANTPSIDWMDKVQL